LIDTWLLVLDGGIGQAKPPHAPLLTTDAMSWPLHENFIKSLAFPFFSFHSPLYIIFHFQGDVQKVLFYLLITQWPTLPTVVS
jgi:hypothetical protein